ncbi:MAG: phosphatidylserine decarboxylase family protein [Deltaproteobacteria bacterium]|nr:phosphatidylserine decarboxylase family protein [Deltaproteobacteria bacterium]
MEPYFLNRPMRKLSIFLSVLNVHINRVPIGGRVVGTRYIPGRFRIASHRNASEENERNAIWLQGDGGEEVVMVQVAGLIARRIVSYVREGDKVDRCERCGLIRFGSRVDLYLPLSWPIAVQVGARVRGGASLVARIGDHQ